MKPQLIRWIRIALLLLLASPVAAQVRVYATLDSSDIQIGDQATIQVEIINGYYVVDRVDLSSLDTLPYLEVLNRGKLEATPRGFVQRIVVTSFEPGEYQLPPIAVVYNSEGTGVRASSNPLTLVVKAPPVDSAALAPIKDILPEEDSWWDWWPFAATLLVLVLLIAAYVRWRRQRHVLPVPGEPSPPPAVPAHETALARLRQLETAQLWQQGDVKGYYSGLSFIVREYLEGRYGILALESTTAEIIAALDAETGARWAPELRQLLSTADLAKFAKAAPSEETHRNLFNFAVDFVEKTHILPIENDSLHVAD